MQEESTNPVQSFGGKHFKMTVKKDDSLGMRAHLYSTGGDDIEVLLESRGLDVGQLMELSLLTAMATVMVGLFRGNATGVGKGE